MAAENGFLTWLGQAAVIAVGWYVVHKNTAQRDKEKTRRDVLVKIADTLSDDVGKILSIARDYHIKPREVSIELKLKMDLQDLAMRVSAISDIYDDQALLGLARGNVGALRRAVTGAHFEDEHTQPLSDNDRQHLLIVEAVLDLKRTLVKIKNRQLCP